MKHQLLFIDDNPMMGGFLSQLFGKEYEVMWCNTADEALNWLEDRNVPDLIICDYQLEGLSGFDFLQRVKKSGFFKDIPVIMLSGAGTSENKINCLKEGAEDFVIKPFNPTELSIKVSNTIKKHTLIQG